MMILPVVSAGLSAYLPEDLMFVSTAFMVSSSAIGVVNTIYNFGKAAQKHDEFSGRYRDFSREIAYTLCRKKRDRSACDVTVQRFLGQVKALNGSAPPL